MLAQGKSKHRRRRLSDRIRCHLGDAKSLLDQFGDASFEGVCSNTIIHHIPDPEPVLDEMARLVAHGGTLLVRDLVRPASHDEIARLTDQYAGLGNSRGAALFEASLRARPSPLKRFARFCDRSAMTPRECQ